MDLIVPNFSRIFSNKFVSKWISRVPRTFVLHNQSLIIERGHNLRSHSKSDVSRWIRRRYQKCCTWLQDIFLASHFTRKDRYFSYLCSVPYSHAEMSACTATTKSTSEMSTSRRQDPRLSLQTPREPGITIPRSSIFMTLEMDQKRWILKRTRFSCIERFWGERGKGRGQHYYEMLTSLGPKLIIALKNVLRLSCGQFGFLFRETATIKK